MSAAVWIALGAVFIAIAPAIIAGSKASRDKKTKDDGANAGASDTSSSSGDCGGDGGGCD